LKKIIVLLVFIVKAVFVFCQNDNKTDTLSIVSYVDKIIIKINLDTQTDLYSVKTSDKSDFELAANNQYKLVLSLDYEFLGLSIGFAPKFLPGNNDNKLKGESEFSDFSFRFFIGDWTQNLRYEKIKGFYVENTKSFNLDLVEGYNSYILLPNFSTKHWEGSTSYILNNNFSLRNIAYNTEWQRKSAGSLIPSINYGYLLISSEMDGIESYEKSIDLNISAQYYYTYVIHKNWFISSFLSPSFGVRFSKSGIINDINYEKSMHWPFLLNGGLQIGFSSENIIFGTNLNFETFWYNENKQTHVTNNKVFAKIYLGLRLNPPKTVKKSFNWFNEKL
jgi:hypothetical protein